MYRNIIFFSFIIIFCCCSEDEIAIPPYQSKIVVDGWIEEGEVPRVILTYSSSYFSEIDSFNIFDFVDARAKVTVSDGDTKEILTLQKQDKYFPPFIYSGQEMKGVAGETYTLTIEQPPIFLTAESKIPVSPTIDSVWFEFISNPDTLGIPIIVIKDDPETKNYYRVLTRRYGIDKRFVPALVPNFSDAIFEDEFMQYQVYKSSDFEIIKDDEIYFEKGDSIMIKVLTMNQEIFEYWSVFYNEQFNSGNPFADSKIQPRGNISGEGLGIWAAYGKNVASIRAQ